MDCYLGKLSDKYRRYLSDFVADPDRSPLSTSMEMIYLRKAQFELSEEVIRLVKFLNVNHLLDEYVSGWRGNRD